MSRYFMALVLVATSSVMFYAMAQQTTPKVKRVPVQRISPASGQQMYATYCASCHGAEGRGNGPAAQSLKVTPKDLTTLSKHNGGVFPSAHVSAVLQFGVENPAHGSTDMPVWGSLLQTLNSSSKDSSVEVYQRIQNLTGYIKQIQK
jgi:mono/diheme cytochrome c family protein